MFASVVALLGPPDYLSVRLLSVSLFQIDVDVSCLSDALDLILVSRQ